MKVKNLLLLSVLSLFAGSAMAAPIPEDVNELYLIGDAVASGWSRDQAPQLMDEGNGIYTWTGTLKSGEFKFLVSRYSWNSVVAAQENCDVTLDKAMDIQYNSETGSEDYKWKLGEGGAYTVVVNLKAATLTVSKAEAFVPTSFALTGVVNLTVEPAAEGVYKYFGEVKAGSFKISATNGKTTKWVKTVSAGAVDYAYVSDEANATAFTADKDMPKAQLIINAVGNTVKFNEYTPWEHLYIVGSYFNWSFNEMTKVDDERYSWRGYIGLSNGTEIKFHGTTDWDGNYGIHPYENQQAFLKADNFYVGGDDNKWQVTEEGDYVIEVNLFKQTVSVKKDVVTAVEEIEVNGNVISVNGDVITVSAPAATNISVYSIDGRVLYNATATEANVNVHPGCYVVTCGNNAQKVLVK